MVFVASGVLPLVDLFVELVRRPDALGAVLDARRRGLLFNTATLGLGTAVVATVIGAPLGMLLGRVAVPHKALLRLMLAAPALLPPYVVGLAWVYLRVLSEWTFTLPAAVVVLSLVFYPVSMLATEVAVRMIDGRLEEAALMVAPPGRVLRRITLPLVAPGTIAAALLIFVLAVSEFGVPGLLQVRVYTTEVFTAFAALYDVTRAIALTVPLLTLCVGVAAVAAMVAGDRLVTTPRSRAASPPLFDRWRSAGVGAAIGIVGVGLGIPIVVLMGETLRIDSLAAVLAGSGRAIVNGLVLAILGATTVVSVAIVIGYGRARTTPRVGRVADVVLVALFAVPSTVMGVGLITMWNRPGPLGLVYGTQGMFLLAYLARFVPIAALTLAASVRYVPVSHEEAAALAGANWPRAMMRIVLPQMRAGIAAAWVIVFVLAFGELGTSILIAPPGETTLPIRIYTLIANAPSSHVAAFALLQTLVVLSGVAVLGAMAARREGV